MSLRNRTVIVGMSGGVDSSVSALLLKQQGFRVVGLFMKNWEEPREASTICPSAKEYEDVVRVAELLEIPYYAVNFVEEYRESVFARFLADLQAGYTPNPDILCNREIKFHAFLRKAKELGADFLATGHYCQLDPEKRLLKGHDPEKDQSYFLHAVSQTAFQSVLFPIGHLTKQEVRAIARQHQLPTAEKKDSTGICFIGKRNFNAFIQPYVGFTPGEIQTLQGQKVGQHQGLAYHTLGQRKGLGLGGEGEPWYVVGKEHSRNVLLVERGANHPALFSQELFASELSWVSSAPSPLPFACTAKVRYRQQDQPCILLSIAEGIAHVRFDQPQRAVTPGQSVVFYEGNRCLGGGVIQLDFGHSKPSS